VCDDKEGHFIVKYGEHLNAGRCECPTLVDSLDLKGLPLTDRIERLLGQGTFGKVVEAFDNDTERWVAVKIIRSIQKYRCGLPCPLVQSN
jgi:dual-specificity kinase